MNFPLGPLLGGIRHFLVTLLGEKKNPQMGNLKNCHLYQPTNHMLRQTLNTLLKHELRESTRRIQELHAAYLAAQHTMDNILRFTALSHPVLSYYMRCIREDHEARKRHQHHHGA